MLRLFSRRKVVDTKESPGKVQQWLMVWAMRFQTRWAQFMQRRMERFSVRGKKAIVILCCIVGTAYCCRIIYYSFYNRKEISFSITPIQQPAHITETGEARIEKDVIISENEYRQIREFHSYIDSLYASAAGKAIADSILLLRPGLMDSIYQLEQLYKQNKIK